MKLGYATTASDSLTFLNSETAFVPECSLYKQTVQRQILYIDHKEQNAADRVKYKAAALKGYIKKLLEKQKARDANLFEIIQLSQQFTEVYQQISALR